jgi:hypothetical protein
MFKGFQDLESLVLISRLFFLFIDFLDLGIDLQNDPWCPLMLGLGFFSLFFSFFIWLSIIISIIFVESSNLLDPLNSFMPQHFFVLF